MDKVCHMDDVVSRKITTTVAPLIFIACLAAILRNRPDIYGSLVKEDGVIEYATCCAYLVAAFAAFLASRRSISAGVTSYGLTLLAFAGLLFVVAMEEISWGQRLFGFGTPQLIAEHNVQGEMSLHNLGGFQQTLLHPAYMLVGFAASVGSLLIPGYIKDRLPRHWRSLVPPPRLFFYFFPTFAFYFVNELIHPYTRNAVLDGLRAMFRTVETGSAGDGSWVHQEPVEFILSAGFLLMTLRILSDARSFREPLAHQRAFRDADRERQEPSVSHAREPEKTAGALTNTIHLPLEKL